MRHVTERTMLVGGGALVVAIGVLGLTLGGALFSAPPDNLPASPPEPLATLAPEEADAPADEPTRVSSPEPGPASSSPEEIAEAPAGSETEDALAESMASDGAALSNDLLGLAVARSPFAENRRPSAQRYRMPGEEVRAAPEPPELPPAPDFVLLGAVAGADGGFAVIRVDDGPPMFVSQGDSVQGYTLTAVEADRAVMAGVGRMLEVPLATASPTVENDDDDDSRRRRRRRSSNDDDSDDASSQQQAAVERARALMEQVEVRGAGPVSVGDDGTITIMRPGGNQGVAQGRADGPRMFRGNAIQVGP